MFTVARGLFNFLLLKTMRSKAFDWVYQHLNKPWNHGPREKVSLNQAVAFLNELLKVAPEAIQALLESRVPCGEKLAHHPSVQVITKDGQAVVGLLGILNGLFGKDKNGIPQIIAEYDKAEGKLMQFWAKEDWEFQIRLWDAILECAQRIRRQ
jgi:hypothetical protein